MTLQKIQPDDHIDVLVGFQFERQIRNCNAHDAINTIQYRYHAYFHKPGVDDLSVRNLDTFPGARFEPQF